jgi:amidohydrolase
LESYKQAVCAAIDKNRDRIIAIGEQILKNPELGYKEFKTSKLVDELFKEIGLQNITHHAITGVKGWLRGRSNKTHIAILGELDAVLSPAHPFSDPVTGAAHSCGHNTQIAALIGSAMGLIASGVLEKMDGDICFFATPAEEYVELEYRKELVKQGKIAYLSGKQELIATGAFDDIDMAIMTHSETDSPVPRVVVNGTAMGFIGKTVQFIGKEAHAGGAPHEGINALNAASIAIMCINAQRETFRDCDSVRVHPIITKGGDMVNTVPADVRMESFVRANNIEAMQNANKKVNRAIEGASYAIGTEVKIDDMIGYLPLHQNSVMSELFAANTASLLGTDKVFEDLPFAGSTDMGDLGYILPVIQPTISGFTGAAHGKDFTITDKEYAYIIPAKLMAMTVIDLLSDNAKIANQVKESQPRKTVKQYKKEWDDILEIKE